jgi:superoxide dismutase, Cu-Zn family
VEVEMKYALPVATISLFVCVACGPQNSPPATEAAAAPASAPIAAAGAPQALPAANATSASSAPISAKIEPRSGSNAGGQVTLTATKDGVRVEVLVTGVSPGNHGLHFHENGDCSAPDATSAKGHFNPMQHPHGLPDVEPRHLGDLGNILVDASGQGKLVFSLAGATLDRGATNSLRGRAVILHDKTDDGSQPVGNAGARIGCAVIP